MQRKKIKLVFSELKHILQKIFNSFSYPARVETASLSGFLDVAEINS